MPCLRNLVVHLVESAVSGRIDKVRDKVHDKVRFLISEKPEHRSQAKLVSEYFLIPLLIRLLLARLWRDPSGN